MELENNEINITNNEVNIAKEESNLIQELIREINQIIENSKLQNNEQILVIDRFEENFAVCENRITR